jgi:endonuclease/exonuclease/phosphatase family metal-dependent hydrolase
MAFRLIYWNVWCFPSLLTDGRYSDRERATLIAPHIRDYDLAILNEVWTEKSKETFRREYPHHYTIPSRRGKIFDSGLLVLSKTPILNPKKIIYDDASGWDWFSAKGAIHFQLKIAGKTLDFFTTHMQAGYSKTDQHARSYQFLQLVNFVNSNMPSSDDVFLIGDFNVMPLINRTKSVHCHDMNDAILRATSYNMLVDQTGLIDQQKGSGLNDVYHVFTKRADDKTKITYHDSSGLSDGPYLVIEFPA